MARSTFKSGVSYFSTYLLLTKDYLAYLGAKAVPIVSGVVAANLIYPIPFAIMAAAIYAMLAGHHTSTINISRWKFVTDVDSAFLYALLLAGFTLTFKYAALRTTLTSTIAWQTSLLWRAINQLPAMARWDTQTAIPLPLRAEVLGNFLTSIVRSGFLVGHIISIALPNLAVILVALPILAWLDPLNVVVLVITAVLFLPFYAWALFGLIGVRSKYAQQQPVLRHTLKEVLNQGVLAGAERQIDLARLSAEDASRFAAGYARITEQLQRLNLIGLLVGLHAFISIAIIYVINGASLSVFVRDKIMFMVVLLFMLKAIISLIGLLSRLSRSYGSLAILRAYLHPKRKRPYRVAGAPEDAHFALQARHGERGFLQDSKPWFVVIPKAVYAFELLPLSNGLRIVKAPKKTALPHIVFFDQTGLEAFLEGDKPKSLSIEIPDKKHTFQLPVSLESPSRDQLFAVALSVTAWEHLVQRGEADTFCANRAVFIVISEPVPPRVYPTDACLVVSDGAEILALGAFAETWERFAEEAFRRAGRKEVKLDIDDDEQMES